MAVDHGTAAHHAEYDTDHVHCCPDPPDGDGEVICHASDGMR